MRIGIDGGCLSNRRGFGRFARGVVGALAEANPPHEFVVLVDRPSLESVRVPAGFETVAVNVREAPSRAASASGRRGVRDLLAMGRAASKSRLDLMYFPASYSFFPVWNVPRVVVTMHDTLALAHPGLVFPSWKGRFAWAVKEHAAVMWADRIATVSWSARRDLLTWFGLPESRIVVIPEGPERVFRPIAPGRKSDEVLGRFGVDPGRPFLLYVGGLSPHKNLVRLIEAFAIGAPEEAELVLVGDLGDVFLTHVPELRNAVDRSGLVGRVRFTGFVPDDDLAHFYNRAFALIQPSLMEGFGLPPVEAMACGTPVLASRAGSLPEVIGGAGTFFDPTNVGGIAAAIRGLFAEPERRSAMAARALERSRRYSWEASARALISLFDDVLGRPARGEAA